MTHRLAVGALGVVLDEIAIEIGDERPVLAGFRRLPEASPLGVVSGGLGALDADNGVCLALVGDVVRLQLMRRVEMPERPLAQPFLPPQVLRQLEKSLARDHAKARAFAHRRRWL